jgi:hypothetical protein
MMKKTSWLVFGALLFCGAAQGAAVPGPEHLLPDDTLVLVTAPDFGKLKEAWLRSPQGGFWRDESMKPFREKFFSNWQEEMVQPLERELDVHFDDYASLPQGQVTFALTLNGASAQPPLGVVLLLDTKDKSTLLRSKLAELRQKWAAAGKPIRSEKIRNFEFSVLPMSSNEVPKTLKRFFPPVSQLQEPPSDEPAPKAPPRTEWVAGQADSLLIVGNSMDAVDRIVARLTGDPMPSLGETAAYEADRQALFRDTPLYGWVNVKALMEYLTRKSARRQAQPEDPLVPFEAEKLLAASGLAGLKTAAFAFQSADDGTSFKMFVGAPESGRAGLFKILGGEAKETAPPPFVPAEVCKFGRWRLDGQKSWAGLERMLTETSPQYLNGINFVLDTVDMAAKEKDPTFDVRKSLIGNLGDDLISFEKPPRAASAGGENQGPSLYLIGSPKAEQLAASLKSILLVLNPQSAPAEREFLGRKIFSAPAPALPMPMGEVGPAPAPRTLYWAASGSYVPISTDATMLEEYLRSSESQGKSLREAPGLVEAMSRVVGPGTSLFMYENQVETTRAAFEALKKDSGSARSNVLNPLNAVMGLAGQAIDLKGLMDYSLLPAFDKVEKYFSFTVYGGSANVDGLSFQTYSPVSPGLKLVAGLASNSVRARPAPVSTNSATAH